MHVEQSPSFVRLHYLVLLFSPYLPECTILPQRLQVNSSVMGEGVFQENKNGTQLHVAERFMKIVNMRPYMRVMKNGKYNASRMVPLSYPVEVLPA